MIKKPSNRHALPKVIISEVNSENILEFKIKYEKLARLDKIEVKAMHYDNRNIVFVCLWLVRWQSPPTRFVI